PPLKLRVAGRSFDQENKKYVPVDYKFAITPLIPSVIKNRTFEAISNNMIRQNVGLLLFSTASKHSAITSPEGTYNNFYNENNEPNTGDYVINPVPTDYFFEVVTQPSGFKEEV